MNSWARGSGIRAKVVGRDQDALHGLATQLNRLLGEQGAVCQHHGIKPGALGLIQDGGGIGIKGRQIIQW